jgi:hypothetical protein
MRKIKLLISTIVMCAACTAHPHSGPPKAELVGKYVLTEVPAACQSSIDGVPLAATVQLGADGSFKIDGLPSCFAGAHASAPLAGSVTGRWSVIQVEGEYMLELLVENGPLQIGWNLGVQIRGRIAPFELYFRVG